MSNIRLNNERVPCWLFTSMYNKYDPPKNVIHNLIEYGLLIYVKFIKESKEYGCEYEVDIEFFNKDTFQNKETNLPILGNILYDKLRISSVDTNTKKIVNINGTYKIVDTELCDDYKMKLEGLLYAILSKVEDKEFKLII